MMTHKNVTAILASLVYIIEKVKFINVFVTALSCLRLISFFVFLRLFIFLFFFSVFVCCSVDLVLVTQICICHIFLWPTCTRDSLWLVKRWLRQRQNNVIHGQKSRTRTRKISHSHAQNLGLARTANQTKNMSHNTFNYRDFIMKTHSKTPITSLIQHTLFTGNLEASNEIHNIQRKS